MALAAVQNQRNRQGEFETKNLETPCAELPTKTVKAVTQVNSAIEATPRNALEINYEKAAAEAINKVKQDLAAKEIEQRLKQEIERLKMNEAIEFSSIDNVEDTTGNTPETVKDESQAKRTSFTERLAIMVGMKSRDAAVEETKAEKGKTFGTVSTKTTDTDQNEDQIRPGTATINRTTTDHGTATLELGDLMAKLDQIDKKLKHSEEDRDVMRREIRNNKHEYLDSYFNLARATEERLQQMSDKVDTTDEERDKNIRKDMQEMKQRYDAVNSQLGNLETKMDTMSRDQVESSCAIQTKLDAILRNSMPQDRPAAKRTQGNRVDFVESQRNKRQSTPLPLPRDAASTAPGGGAKQL